MLWSPQYFTPVHNTQLLCAEYTMDPRNPQHSISCLMVLHMVGVSNSEACFKHTACAPSIHTKSLKGLKWHSVSFAGVQLREMWNDTSFKSIWIRSGLIVVLYFTVHLLSVYLSKKVLLKRQLHGLRISLRVGFG